MAYEADFGQFWNVYPRKIGKLAARKAFEKAMKTGVTLEQLTSAVSDYVRCKPAYADFCHASTWLNAGRWEDQWDVPQKQAREDWFEECKRLHDGACELDRHRHMMRMKHGPLPSEMKRT